MKEFKGTQGKWSQSHRMLQNGGYSTQVYCEKGNTIATIDWYLSEPKETLVNGVKAITQGTDREANALLISKAPEILEMLQELCHKVDFSLFTNGDDVGLRLEQLIKQATEL